MDIIGKRYLYFAISLLIIVPGLLSLLIWGFPLAIDFTGGSLLEVQFEAGKALQPSQVVEIYDGLSISSPQVQSAAGDSMVIRSKDVPETVKSQVVAQLEKASGGKVTVQRFDTVGPSVAKEVGTQATVAVAVAALAIILYISFAFRGVPHSYRFGTAAVIATLHHVAVGVGMEALLGHFLGWEADSLFLTALLTVIGFSVHDTIVVFDRVRENSNIHRRLPFETVVNHSIVQTLDRSINTQLTVMFTLLAMVLFGGITIRHFVVILLIGVFSGTYSSIFNASPILVVWENREWRYWFRGNWKKPSTVTTSN
jgi:preprotein translocase subunit SecF